MSDQYLKNKLADELKAKGYLHSAQVEAAFRSVGRHLFVPEVGTDRAYHDEVIPIETSGEGVASSASQPSIVAGMLEELGLAPGQRVLEIGAGSGYNAALMAHIVGEEGRVVTVEIDENLADRARRALEEAGYGGVVEVVCGDGGLGYPEEAPYDRVIVTAGAPDIAPPWWGQLSSEGRMVLPLEIWSGLQVCTAFEEAGGHLESVEAQWCGFVGLAGEFGGGEQGGYGQSPPEEDYLREVVGRLREGSLASGLSFPPGLRIRAYPKEREYVPSPEESVVEKSYTYLVFEWP